MKAFQSLPQRLPRPNGIWYVAAERRAMRTIVRRDAILEDRRRPD